MYIVGIQEICFKFVTLLGTSIRILQVEVDLSSTSRFRKNLQELQGYKFMIHNLKTKIGYLSSTMTMGV